MAPSQLLLIAGMHRSGTSALCSALEQCGVQFGDNLLDPMAGVNEEGFWEDADAVALNEAVLARLGGSWYAPPPGLAQTDWYAEDLCAERERLADLLERDQGEGALQAIKDPRLCLTLPLWLAACEEKDIAVTVCMVSRAPLEVAHSLQKRDGFPLGYGLRLYAQYRRQLLASAPADSPHVNFNALLADPAAALAPLADRLSLDIPAELERAVRSELRHHDAAGGSILQQADIQAVEQAALEDAVEREYPREVMQQELLGCLVGRAEELTRLGQDHTAALATLDQRDTDVENLSALHTEALATIDERDEQIREFDRRLTETGEQLEVALNRLQEIQRIMSLPVLGHMLRLVKWVYEKR